MKKYILQILIIASLLVPSISQALSVYTQEINSNEVTYTTAILRGNGGTGGSYLPGCNSYEGYSTTTGELCNSVSTSSSPVTAYFRYSRTEIAPIFCNDIYGSNMIATNDINLGANTSVSFWYKITNLVPGSTYYYCAIVSDKDNIAYGGKKIVKRFDTVPYTATIKTNSASSVKINSAKLNGFYRSGQEITTYFEYKKASTGTATSWTQVNVVSRELDGQSSIVDDFSFDLTGLDSGTRYQFRAVGKIESGNESKIVYGNTLSFSTGYNSSGAGSGTGTGGGSGIGTGGGTGTGTGGGGTPESCSNGAVNYPLCSTGSTGLCLNGATNPPTCSTNAGTCSNGATNPLLCTINNAGACLNGSNNPPLCKLTSSSCSNGAVNYPICSIGGGGTCLNGATNPPTCSTNAGTCSNGATNPLLCTINNAGACLNGSTNPPICNIVNTNVNNGNWTGANGGNNGNWGTGRSSGSWIATTGRGGIGVATWTGSGNGTGTWTSATGSGTWSNGTGTGGAGTGTWGEPLQLGQTAIPPSDAIVRFEEGIETVFTRQIIANKVLAVKYGYREGIDNLETFAWNLSDQFARMFGYINTDGKEIRVSFPDVAAYQLQLLGDELSVYEYYENKIIDIRNITTIFKNASDYEYYFKKNG